MILKTLSFPPRLPEAFLRQCREAESKIDESRLEDFRRKIAAGYIAPSYSAKISDAVGNGLFADRDFQAGEMIGEYAGVLSRDWGEFNPYLLKYPFETPYAIDAREHGNAMRLVNHSSENSNVSREYVLWEQVLRVIFVAQKPIKKRGQLLLDYGEAYWRGRECVEIES